MKKVYDEWCDNMRKRTRHDVYVLGKLMMELTENKELKSGVFEQNNEAVDYIYFSDNMIIRKLPEPANSIGIMYSGENYIFDISGLEIENLAEKEDIHTIIGNLVYNKMKEAFLTEKLWENSSSFYSFEGKKLRRAKRAKNATKVSIIPEISPVVTTSEEVGLISFEEITKEVATEVVEEIVE